MNDLDFLRKALHLAKEHSGQGQGGPFGAVVVHQGEIMGEGWNQVVKNQDPTAHAEILAIRDAATRLGTHILADCQIYCSCEPCPMCLSAIYWARIPTVMFAASGEDAQAVGFDDTVIGRELILPWADRSLVTRQALAGEGRELLLEWAKDPNRIEY